MSMVSQEIPDKKYFKIGEVAELVGVEPHVLRFWESEFSRAKPERAGSGQRLYTRTNIELFLEIKNLLYEDMYTIAGAKKKLASKKQQPGPGPAEGLRDLLLDIGRELNSLKKMLDEK